MKYDIEADWVLLSACNYRCDYCFWNEKELNKRIQLNDSVKSIITFFERSELTWLVHLTGGEPFAFPGFTRLCQGLVGKHFISLNTNLSLPGIDEFKVSIDPKRVSFINCALHIQQREQREGISLFLRRFHSLQKHGFRSFVSYVMVPSLFDRFEDDFCFFKSEGIPLIPKMLQGTFAGEIFPDAYTESQRQLFNNYSLLAEDYYCQIQGDNQEKESINLSLDREFVSNGIPDYRGRLCQAGYKFVRIRENGDIRRCGPADVLGNLLSGIFYWRGTPSVCSEMECPYFCAKYVLPSGSAPDSK